jgi:murein DD-endopeptidase MepM/ murein hydrolase activator NlpD
MSKRAISRGKRVKQGDIIGYVGATGLAEAPHLHYEFLVNGVHRNPRTVKLPQADPISKSELAAFKLATAPVLTQLAQNQAPAEFALNGARAANQAGSTSAN